MYRHFVPISTLLNIYESLISPYISFGIAVWGHAAQIYLKKILVLQKRVIRLIHFAEYRSHAIPFFCSFNIPPLNLVYFKTISVLMHDISNNLAPVNIKNLFIRSNEIHSHNTRSSSFGNYYVKPSRLNQQSKSFERVGVNIWNCIYKYATFWSVGSWGHLYYALLYYVI